MGVAELRGPLWRGLASALALAVLAVTLIASSACFVQNCDDVAVGEKLAITVVRPWYVYPEYGAVPAPDAAPPTGPGNCDYGFDVMQGQVLHATVVSTGGDIGCHDGLIAIDPFGAWTWTLSTGPDYLPGSP